MSAVYAREKTSLKHSKLLKQKGKYTERNSTLSRKMQKHLIEMSVMANYINDPHVLIVPKTCAFGFHKWKQQLGKQPCECGHWQCMPSRSTCVNCSELMMQCTLTNSRYITDRGSFQRNPQNMSQILKEMLAHLYQGFRSIY
eukprot:TRINITY_DN2127_c0_g1_i1.p1 TRINITY_DN2127_c0_g1~~TRINITY_DN2127_c0_g1_i1.p1  ORF type:complete len:156 (+),score=12.06 TRINITY_DN2127_c0_g1_i1:44-469(+)